MIGSCIFIGGCSRSGTTFLGSILGGSDRVITTPESQFKSDLHRSVARGEVAATPESLLGAIGAHWRFRLWESPLPDAAELASSDVTDVVLAVVDAYARSLGKPGRSCWVDHSPDNIRDAPWLLRTYPGASMIHVVRDGRAVASSLMRMDVGPNTIMAAAKLWVHSIAVGLAMESAFPERVLRVHYESLVDRPEESVQRICEFTGLEYTPAMLNADGFEVPRYTKVNHGLVGRAPDASAVHRWRESLTPRQVELFEVIAGPVLQALGYELVFQGHARPATRWERLVGLCQDVVWGRARSSVLHSRRRRRAGV